ncbi:uncharacterized protein B0H64DRAFT_427150 [Chaetomium fimeti]|uniref:Uncharacterized protein n=1 Tax=Chaetomium fimeti TaxID=1854472 RepID=A0AAE0LNQ2_9PEZI|nr:hypothetical protein B0H64DRAFT_427150 [Chaetomium fimeti]
MMVQPLDPKVEHLVAQLGESLRNMKTDTPAGDESEEKLIIALDFGTTFSGIAYCFANQRDTKVAAILDWPGAEGESAPKIPTLINYSSPRGGEFAWGASVNRMRDNIVGVKLLLDPSQERPLYLPTGNIKRTIKSLPKPPVEIAADFIGAVYRHAQNEIAKVVPKEYLKICQRHFVLSVPAVWSDAAKNATLQASKIAGIYPVTLIKEPEAAALYTMHALDFSLNVGDAFVVCDAGGGTVDLISYEVVGLSPNLQVKELVPGTGGMAGSLGLNQRFVEAVRNLVGEEQFADLRKTKGFLLAEKSFDREVKRAFKGDPDEEYFINFPMASLDDDPDLGLEANCWRMTGKDLKTIFAPLITDILRLIDDQVKSVRIKRPTSGVTGIFLVGGFGSSQYLKGCVEKKYPGIQVLQPTDAWAAIVKGAALSQLPRQATVLATSATHHYGVEAWEIYDPELDSGVPTQIRRDGTKRAERMTWFINIGDDVLRDQKIKFSFYRSISENYTPDDLIFQDTLFECADPVAPTHHCKGDKISSNCLLTADLRSVPSSQFVSKADKKGQGYYQAVELDIADQQNPDRGREPEPGSAQSPQSWTPTSATTELPPYSKSGHSNPPVLVDAELPWRPFYLQRRVLLCFAAVFALVVAAIETLLVVSDKNSGIASSTPNRHYLWTYGPTAFLTLIAAVWSRAEYQSKLVAPWIRLSGHPAQPKHTLLLDYFSDFQLFAVFRATRNRDFAVLIVISTGLIALSWTLDRFIDSPVRLSDAGTLSYYVMQGLITTNYAFQSVSTDLPDTAETRVIVDGFGNSLECQPAELTLKGAAPPDPHYTDERGMNLTITSPGCNIEHLQIRPSPVWPCTGHHREPCDVLFTRFTSTRRILVVFGNMTYSVDFSITLDDYTGAHTRHPYLAHMRESAQMLCVPTYGITKVNVVRNGTQTRRVTMSPGATSRTLDSVTGWDLADAHSAAFYNDLSSAKNPYGKTRKVDNTSVDVDEVMDFALPTQLAPGQPLSSLFEVDALQRFATAYYAQVAAIIAKQSLMESASMQTHASVTLWRNRLVIRNWAAHLMAGLAATCFVLTTVAVFLVPKRGILPCSPATLPGMASLVRYSPDLLAMLRFSGAADAKRLSRPLLASTFRSGVAVDPASSQPYFTILSELRSTDRRSHTFQQVDSKQTHPVVLHPAFRAALCLILAMLIVALELTLRKSTHEEGLGDARDDDYMHHTWTTGPAVVFGGLSMLLSAMDFQIRSLAPYVALKQGVTPTAYKTLDFMDTSVPRTIFREIKFTNIGALAATTGFLIASVFTIFSASLFQPLAIPTTIPVSFRANQSFDMTPISSDDGNVVASLIFGSNFSFPIFTYDDLAFPQLVPTTPLSSDGRINKSTVSIEAVVPALRTRLTCRVYDSSKITTNHTLNYTTYLGSYDNPLGINIEGEECNRFPEYEPYGYNNILSTYPNVTYFAMGMTVGNVSEAQGCSDLLYTWGKLNHTADPIIQHITSVGCNETIETLSVATTFLGANLTIDPSHPPLPLENTTRPTNISTYGFMRAYSRLARLSTAPNYLTPFFAMLTSSPWAIPLPSLGTPSATPQILRAIHHHHGLIQAQTLAQNLLPANTTNTTLPVGSHPVNTTDDMFTYPGTARWRNVIPEGAP